MLYYSISIVVIWNRTTAPDRETVAEGKGIAAARAANEFRAMAAVAMGTGAEPMATNIMDGVWIRMT